MGSLAIPEFEPLARRYVPLARFLEKLLFESGRRSWLDEGRIQSAMALDLSEGGLRLATSYLLWPDAFVLLRVPSRTLMAFGYTALGEVIRVKRTVENEIEAGVAFTAIHESDRAGLVRFITTPLPQLAAERHPQQSSA
ncbi:MAG: PilZ domain-containing protein [Nitrospirae bacterium]|nr:PilZ domain-containing protein [Nitrospirota bacterium]